MENIETIAHPLLESIDSFGALTAIEAVVRRTAEPSAVWGQRYVEALVDCPGAQDLYTYILPSELSVQPGDILSVPFGAQQVGAIAVRLLDSLPETIETASLRSVEDVVAQGFFPPQFWQLLERVADYYRTPLMSVVRVALPPGLLGRSQRRIRLKRDVLAADTSLLYPAAQQLLNLLQQQKDGDYAWQYLQRQVRSAHRGLRQLLQLGWVESYLEPPATVRPKQRQAVILVAPAAQTPLSVRQREVLEVLKRRGGDMWLQELLQVCNASSSVIKLLEQKGCVVLQSREVLRADTSGPEAADVPQALTAPQDNALSAIRSLSGYAQVLLHGVTGSGKTEVYLQAIAPLLSQGQSALVLVPEIGLTPQLTDRFRARFGSAVRVYHSALSEGERYDTWRQMLSGGPQVVIGTRSAVFAPLARLGLIVLDEEHDGSFKQDQPAPCYHARTVAQWRAELAGCPLLLGSATPALETWALAKPLEGKPVLSAQPSLYLSLPDRVQARPLPTVEVVDMRQELQQGNRSIFSRSLQEAIADLKSQQGLLFIHRRGHSTFVSCRSCGYVMQCPHCDVSLAYHQVQTGGSEILRCHYCGYSRLHPTHCPDCQSPYLKHFGSGTQRVMQAIGQQFPNLRCIRFDSDTTRAKGAHRTLLTRFARGEADLLVGTQMLTKGIDLPQVTLVGIIAADGLLHMADYRAGERALQTLIQVAGRAGRGDDPGRVILQTYSPQHPVIAAVQRHEYEPFAQAELEQRSLLHYPPYGRLVLLRLSSPDAIAVRQTAEQLASDLRSTIEGEILGPAPAAIARVARRYRWQILLKLAPAAATDWLDLAVLRAHCPSAVSLTIDVDPLNLL